MRVALDFAFVVLVLAVGAVGRLEAGEALSEDAYREAVTGWHKAWIARPSMTSRKEDDCIAAWQQGDPIRQSIDETTPPKRFAQYHDLLRTCVRMALDTADECLLKPRGGPKWGTKFRATLEKQQEIARLVHDQRLDLPARW